jgi:hypothetical protein
MSRQSQRKAKNAKTFNFFEFHTQGQKDPLSLGNSGRKPGCVLVIFIVSASGPSISLNHLSALLAPGGNRIGIQRVFDTTLRQSWWLDICFWRMMWI